MIVINFDQHLARDEIDASFLQRVKEELPGILNWAMIGGREVARRGYFAEMPWHEAAVREMAQSDDLVDSFARLGVKAVPGDRRGVTTVQLRTALRAFAEANGISTEGWTDVTHMRELAASLNQLHGAERAKRQGRPSYRNIGLQDL